MVNRITEWVYVQGKAGINRLQEPDFKYSRWYIKLYLNETSLNTMNKLKEKDGEIDGILNTIQSDQDGAFMFLGRPIAKKFGKGIEEPLAPPVILDKDNNPTREYIGAGSDVTVKLECYKYNKPRANGGKGRAIRLSSVRIDNLVPYNIESLDTRTRKTVEGLVDQPPEF